MKKISFFIVPAIVLLLFSCSKTPVIRSTESDADKVYQEGLSSTRIASFTTRGSAV